MMLSKHPIAMRSLYQSNIHLEDHPGDTCPNYNVVHSCKCQNRMPFDVMFLQGTHQQVGGESNLALARTPDLKY